MDEKEIKRIFGDLDFDVDQVRRKYREEREVRLRPDGLGQWVRAEGKFAHLAVDPHVDPGFTRGPVSDEVDAVVIGAGFGGLLAGPGSASAASSGSG